MGRLASELADVAIVTSDNPRSEEPGAIIEEIVAGATRPVEIEPDRAAAIALALEQARPGDVVLIAGKGAEQGQELADRTIPFDDREVAREALRALGGGAVIPLPLDELRGLGLGRLDGDAAVVTGVQIDSRRIVPGDLFVALDGGAAFLEDARAPRRRCDARPRRRPRGDGRARACRPRPQRCSCRGDHRLRRQDLDEGHPRGARCARTGAWSRPRRASTTRSGCR